MTLLDLAPPRFRAAMAKAADIAFRRNPDFRAAKKGDVCELYVYDAIGTSFFGGGISPQAVADALKEAKGAKTLRVFINSPGGDVFDGASIYNQIRRFDGRKEVIIDGIAASAASMIAMAGDEITMAHTATMMIHEAWGMAVGNAGDLRETADLLDKVTNDVVLASYERTGATKEQLAAWMAAEKWMNAEEAVEAGFADKIDGPAEEEAETSAPGKKAAALSVPGVRPVDANRVKIAAMQMRASLIHRRGDSTNG